MKHSLLLLGVIAALAIGAPAYSQYIFMDVNGDGACTLADALTSSVTSVDVWLDTNHNGDGSTANCSDGTNQLTIFSYDILVHQSGTGSVDYLPAGTGAANAWINNMAGFAPLNAPTEAGADFGVGYSLPSGFLAPGPYKLGSLQIAVTGTPVLNFLTTAPAGIPSPITGFGSSCEGSLNPNTITLGLDFFDNCGTAPTTPTESTTWGKIKQLYH